jgi:hypothetical protein
MTAVHACLPITVHAINVLGDVTLVTVVGAMKTVRSDNQTK